MVSKSALRWLIVLEIFLAIVGAIVEQQALSTMPFGYRDSGGFVPLIGNNDELSWQELAIGIPLLILGLCAYVGVISFMRPGRRLYVLYQVLGLVALPLIKPHTATGWGSLFSGAGSIVTGIILAFLYFTPLKEHFEKKKTNAHIANPPATQAN